MADYIDRDALIRHLKEDRTHIPQKYFQYAHEAVDFWNVKANKPALTK